MYSNLLFWRHGGYETCELRGNSSCHIRNFKWRLCAYKRGLLKSGGKQKNIRINTILEIGIWRQFNRWSNSKSSDFERKLDRSQIAENRDQNWAKNCSKNRKSLKGRKVLHFYRSRNYPHQWMLIRGLCVFRRELWTGPSRVESIVRMILFLCLL